MSFERLQSALRRAKTPLALGIAPTIDQVAAPLKKQFSEMLGSGSLADCEALRYHAMQLLELAEGRLGAVVIDADCFLPYGMMGADVLSNLVTACRAKGIYSIVDYRTTRPLPYLTAENAPDGITVMPYVGGDAVVAVENKSLFATVLTANESAAEVQSLIAGDRPLYVALAMQMARRGAGLVVETGYSLDVRELRRRCGNAFMLLKHCNGENAAPAFDDYGHNACVVDYTLRTSEDVERAIKELKGWVNIA